MDKLIEAARKEAEKRNESLEQAVLHLIEKDHPAAVEQYWKDVEENLRKGKVRLIFVTEAAPKELLRLVEFLNREMANVRLFIIEIKQFLRKGQTPEETQKALVSRAIGVTEPKPPESHILTRPEFLAKCRPEAREFFESMLDKAEAKGHSINWNLRSFAVRAHLPDCTLGSFAYGWLPGEFQFYYGQDGLPLFDEQSKPIREKLLNFGVFTKTRPKTLTAVVDTGNAAKLPKVFDYILEEVDKIVHESPKSNSSQVEHGSV